MTITAELDRLFQARLPRVASMLPDDMLPGTVYHYTNAAGLKGILTDCALWATNFSFLNDPSEIHYGRELVIRILCTMQERIGSAESSGLLQAINERFRELAVSEVYVCSFTTCHDDLNQWRAYGTATEARYCIGFDYEAIEERAAATPNATFSKISYTERKQQKLIQDRVNVSLDFVRAGKALSQRDVREVAKWTARGLADLLPELKSPAYAAEKEWRVIRPIPLMDLSELCFDTRRGVVRPYIAFPLTDSKHLPIVELLVLAPGREDSSVKAAELLPRKAEIKAVRPERSQVPFAD